MTNTATLKVLVIDDDPTITKMLEDMLSHDNFHVHTANTGQDGIRIAHDTQPDVIVLDLIMPGIDGWHVCREIRTFSHTPILILSAVVDAQEVMRALDEGADEYLVKPVTRGVLTARLRRLAN